MQFLMFILVLVLVLVLQMVLVVPTGLRNANFRCLPFQVFVVPYSIQSSSDSQGTLYVCRQHICFWSLFPPKVAIPLAEVIGLEKKRTAKVFDNAFEVQTSTGAYWFAAFLRRDQVCASHAPRYYVAYGNP